ncbi:MAG: alpha/beta fold hydrolase [Gemmataceae bacterium]|nr:alpha/beta fold hydrolase [Gemmataceae bacterium]
MTAPTSTCTVESYTTGDGYACHYRRYRPDGAARAEVVYLHGIQSHGGWYEYSCARLARAGFAVSFLDRRGAGLNEAGRGDAPGFRRLLDDLADFLRPRHGAAVPAGPVRQAPPNSGPPVFLVAVSWGGKLAVALQRRHPGLVDGLALLCPGLFAQVRPPFLQRLRIVWSRLVAPRRLFPIPLSDPELFTANPERQQFIRADPLALRQATARLLLESVRLDGYLRFCRRHVTVPLLLMLAGRDRIIRNERTRNYVARLASTDKQVIEYPEAHHTLEFEPRPDAVIDDLIAWLERHLPPARQPVARTQEAPR